VLKRSMMVIAPLALLLAVLSLAGLRPTSAGDPDPPFRGEVPEDAFVANVESGEYGGTLSIIIDGDLGTLNPLLASGATDQDIRDILFASLSRYDNFERVQRAELASDWDVSDDDLTWTFHLRRGLRWSDGHPFDADDVMFTFDVVADTTVPTSARDNLLVDGRLPDVEKVDEHTVRFRLHQVDALFLEHVGNVHILPEHCWRDAYEAGRFEEVMSTGEPPENVVGLGPYRIVEYSADERVVYTRNPYYWKVDGSGNRLPYFDRVILVIVRDQNTQFLKFLGGEVDILEMLRPEDYRQAKTQAEEKDFSIINLGPALRSHFLCFNLNPDRNPDTGKPYADPVHVSWFREADFRRAVSRAIDRKSMVRQFMDGRGQPLYRYSGPSEGIWHNPDAPTYPYDPDRAEELLEGIGYRDRDGDGVREDPRGNPIRFVIETQTENVTRVNMGNMIADDLRKIGLDVTLRPIAFNSLVDKILGSMSFDAFILGWEAGVPPDPLQGKNILLSSGRLHVWHGGQEKPATAWEAEIDSLVNLMSRTVEVQERKTYYDRVQVILAERQPMIFLATPNSYTAVYNRLGNYKPSVLRPINYHNIEELYRTDSLVRYAAKER
jgi:peptide/nickel transport system substrate-binding protein